jgi:hypothetical protein
MNDLLQSPLFYLALEGLLIPCVYYIFKNLNKNSHDIAVMKNDLTWIKNKLDG